MEKTDLIFFGASHCSRICKFALKDLKIKEKYNVLNYTKAGSVLKDLVVPNFESFKETAILIVWCFGNNILEKHTKFENRIIHLTKFVPLPDKVLERDYTLLLNMLKLFKGKIYILDHVIRHLFCCSLHHYNRLFAHQNIVNKKMKLFFTEQKQIKINFLEHIKLIGHRKKILRQPHIYRKLLPDSVHYKMPIYFTMLCNLLKCVEGVEHF
jgi:hypothetical protein